MVRARILSADGASAIKTRKKAVRETLYVLGVPNPARTERTTKNQTAEIRSPCDWDAVWFESSAIPEFRISNTLGRSNWHPRQCMSCVLHEMLPMRSEANGCLYCVPDRAIPHGQGVRSLLAESWKSLWLVKPLSLLARRGKPPS